MSCSRSTQILLLGACLSISLAGVSCTRQGPTDASKASSAIGNNGPPAITSAHILNSPLSLSSPVTVQIEAEDPEREAVSFSYQWYADGTALAGQTQPTLAPEALRRGQTVSVEIIPADGAQKGNAYRTASVVVGNSPPIVTGVSLTPKEVRPGERIEAQVEAMDPDHDRVELAYKWFRNQDSIKEGEEPFLETTGLSSRDQITVEVTARDPSVSGNSLRSDPLVLGNTGPEIRSNPPAPSEQNHYAYSVRAIDPDGDQLTYRLEAAPPGMTIDRQSGRIDWPLPAEQSGTFHVKVIAEDDRGGLAYQEFDLTLSVQTPAKSVESKRPPA